MSKWEFAPWQRATGCVGGPKNGARHLLAWLIETREGRSGGIYNCRAISGTRSYSIHAEGRAVDWMVPVGPDGKGTDKGMDLVKLLCDIDGHAKRLGIQCVIYNRIIWSPTSPEGRPFTGAHPHYDHLHIELTREAGERLTLATLYEVLGKPERPEATEPKPQPKPTTPKKEDIVSQLKTIDLRPVTSARTTWVSNRKDEMRTLQGLLIARGYAPNSTINRRGRPDGIAGPGTKAALGTFQRATKTGKPNGSPDYIVGANTWKALLRV